MNWNGLELPAPYYSDDAVYIIHGDCREVMPLLPSYSLALLATSPPYFVGKQYENYLKDIEDYWLLLQTCWVEGKRLLARGRTIAVNIAHNGQVDTPAFLSVQLHNNGFVFCDNIIWEKPDGASPRFGSFVQHPYATWYLPNYTYEHLLVYSLGEPERSTQTPIDINWAKGFRGDIWRLRVQTNTSHEAPFPERLISPVITFYTNTGEIILDPFLGSGTTAFCAKKLGRKCIGVEIEERYCEIAAKRCSQMVMAL